MSTDVEVDVAGRVHRLALDRPVPDAQADALARRVFFVSDAIVDFALVRTGTTVTAVEVVLGEPTDVAELGRKLQFVVANDVLAQRQVEPRVVWSRDSGRPPTDVYDELCARGIAWEAGEGQITLGEPLLALMDVLDRWIRDQTVVEFGAREYRYPTIIPTAAMDRCGYFRSFPQLMMFVSRLHADVDQYRGFLDDLAAGGDLTAGLRAHSDNVDYCLPPTMCFHTYHQLADGPLPEPAMVVTARGKSFRFESRYRRSLERLWDFTIREVVFLGPREFVLGGRRRLMDHAFGLLDRLGLGGRCEVASDPFFVDEGTAARAWSQQLLELKYELRVPLEPGRDVAVGSFNFHERFFGEAFGISAGDTVHTACVGFGLERLAYAFVCHHGVDPTNWPGEVRRTVGL